MWFGLGLVTLVRMQGTIWAGERIIEMSLAFLRTKPWQRCDAVGPRPATDTDGHSFKYGESIGCILHRLYQHNMVVTFISAQYLLAELHLTSVKF